MTYKEEFETYKTIDGWSVEELIENQFITPTLAKLKYKDVLGQASAHEKIIIEITDLLLYNNVDHISEEEISETATNILKLI